MQTRPFRQRFMQIAFWINRDLVKVKKIVEGEIMLNRLLVKIIKWKNIIVYYEVTCQNHTTQSKLRFSRANHGKIEDSF